jgi:RNA polymerase sigma-70 factor (ECF subfamily)
MTHSDEELCKLWAAGDKRAGATLVERNYESVDRFFRFKVGEHGVDLTQATFLAAQESLSRKQSDSRFRPWLFGIARHKLLHYLSDHEPVDSGVTSLHDLVPSPTTLIDREQRHRLLRVALRRLPLDVQMMLELHYWEQMPTAEIAEIVGKNANTVRTQMRRGRLRLEELMEELKNSQEELETTRSGLEGWAERVRRECEEDDESDDEDE